MKNCYVKITNNFFNVVGTVIICVTILCTVFTSPSCCLTLLFVLGHVIYQPCYFFRIKSVL